MKQWWLGLSLREKQTLILGGAAVAIFIFYAFIWSPLDNKVMTMRTQIQQNQKLLAWMQAADKKLTNMSEQITISQNSTGSLLSTTQKEINDSSLAKQLTQLRQTESDAVQLSFKQVDFDNLITWLTHSSRQQGFKIAQLTIAPSEAPGIVSAELQLQSS